MVYSVDFDLVFLFLWFQFILDLPREYNSSHMTDVTSRIVPIANNPLVSWSSWEVKFYLLLNALLRLGKPTTVLLGQDNICRSES